MKLSMAGAPVSPSRAADVDVAYGVGVVAASRCSAVPAPRPELPYTGLLRIRAFAAVPGTSGVAGHVSPAAVAGGPRPAGTPQRTREQHIDLDPQRPRPRGGCG